MDNFKDYLFEKLLTETDANSMEVVITAGEYRMVSKPQKVLRGYKQFRTLKSKPNKIFPLFAGKTKPVPLKRWIAADFNPTKGLKDRAGWHSGEVPLAPQLEKRKGGMGDGRVWAEIEYSAEIDYQPEADKATGKDLGHKIPVKGSYKYPASSLRGAFWNISGSMKVIKILSMKEVAQKLKTPEALAVMKRIADAKKKKKTRTRKRK